MPELRLCELSELEAEERMLLLLLLLDSSPSAEDS